MDLATVRIEILKAIFALPADIFFIACRPSTSLRKKPPYGRIVIMRARICNAVIYVVVRQVVIRRVAAKCELKDAHSGKSKVVSKLDNIGGYDAEILGDDRQLA